VKQDTTGIEHYGFQLTPPFPLIDLVELIEAEINPAEEEKYLLDNLLRRKLPPLIRIEVLAIILGVSPKLLYAMAHASKRYYRVFGLPKRGGGIRPIATPKIFLKVVQRWILENILYRQSMPEYVTGFVPRRGTLANARVHIGGKYVLRMDIQDFFPSIRSSQVRALFSEMGFSEKVSAFLTRLTTLNGSLPQGAPSSPYIANLAFLSVDSRISSIAKNQSMAYSRYADDITLSSQHPIGSEVINEIGNTIEGAGFRLNRKKLRLSGPGQRLMTTGLVVHEKAQPVRSLRRNLRARFHQAKLRPSTFVKQANQLLGWASYVNSFEPTLGKKYLKIANKVISLAQKGL
jgi:RNA-directed DNA polymerase